MTKVKIYEIMPFLEKNKAEIKIHCAIGKIIKLEPLYKFSQGKFKNWQESQNNKNFERKYILSMIYMTKNEWLFAGIYQSLSVKQILKENGKEAYIYETKLLKYGNDLIGRLIINFEKDFRQSYLLFEKYIDDLILCEINRQEYKFDPFPGYNNVCINFDLLKEIIDSNESTWKTALSNVKGIYLISDKTNGKFYIGSASGNNAFWQRWANYIENGHGGNKLLRNIINKNGYKYCSNLTFSILEICNLNTTDEEIINKESFWKNRLLTREYGYNDN
jgi:hypothetical protein